MVINAREQDEPSANQRFTVKVILFGGDTPMSEVATLQENGCTHCRGEVSTWPICLIPTRAYDPAGMIVQYIRVSKKVQLDLQEHVYRRGSDATRAYVHRVPSIEVQPSRGSCSLAPHSRI
jgi:hypothetical protein